MAQFVVTARMGAKRPQHAVLALLCRLLSLDIIILVTTMIMIIIIIIIKKIVMMQSSVFVQRPHG